MYQFFQYFSLFGTAIILKLAISLLFWFFIFATVYFLVKLFIYGWGTKSYLVIFMAVSAFAIAIPYIFIRPENISVVLNLNRTRIFIENIIFIGLLGNIFASFFIYRNSHWSKNFSAYLSSLLHLFIGFLGTVGFVVFYTAVFDKYFTLEIGFSEIFIIISIITIFGIMLLWEVIELLVDKYIFGYAFMSLSRQDIVLDLALGVFGIVLAIVFVIFRQEIVFQFLVV